MLLCCACLDLLDVLLLVPAIMLLLLVGDTLQCHF
jgi:hypothetical protein